MKDQTAIMHLELSHLRMASSFTVSILIDSEEMRSPRYSTLVESKAYFESLRASHCSKALKDLFCAFLVESEFIG